MRGSATTSAGDQQFLARWQQRLHRAPGPAATKTSSGTWSGGYEDFIGQLAQRIKADLCLDESRVFAEGFSIGAPTRACIFVGAPPPSPPNERTPWVPDETWDFISQY